MAKTCSITAAAAEGQSVTRLRRLGHWLFADRQTGRIVIAQWPNAALWVFIAAWSLEALTDQQGSTRTSLRMIETLALVTWAADEIWRGVNPWRRFLGVLMLAWLAFRALGS